MRNYYQIRDTIFDFFIQRIVFEKKTINFKKIFKSYKKTTEKKNKHEKHIKANLFDFLKILFRALQILFKNYVAPPSKLVQTIRRQNKIFIFFQKFKISMEIEV